MLVLVRGAGQLQAQRHVAMLAVVQVRVLAQAPRLASAATGTRTLQWTRPSHARLRRRAMRTASRRTAAGTWQRGGGGGAALTESQVRVRGQVRVQGLAAHEEASCGRAAAGCMVNVNVVSGA